MPARRCFKFSRGFIDPLSLIALGFLLVTVVVGSVVTNNKNVSLSIFEKASACVPEGGTYANGTGPCCSGLVQADCVSSGSFSYCICKKPPATTTPTPSTKSCTVRNCSGISCNSTSVTVAYSQACPSSNCTSDSNCSTAPPPSTPVTIHTPAPTPTPMLIATPSPVPECISEGGVVAQGTGSCCTGLIKTDCVSSGSFSYCYCKIPVSPTPTPSSKECTVRNCLGTSCNTTTTTVNYASTCPVSNCVSDANCASNVITCGGKPVGTKECNNSGGYNYCSGDGKWYSKACLSSETCSNGECIAQTASPILVNPTAEPTASCACVGGKYTGNCGHSTGYPCSSIATICEPTECSNKCASQVAGNIGTCMSGACMCSSKKENGEMCTSDIECSSGHCMTYVELAGLGVPNQVTTCITPDEGKKLETLAIAKPAAMAAAGAVGLGILALPEIGTAAYVYGTTALASLPASVQTAAAVTGTAAGFAGMTTGTVACVNNPYSDACVAYVAAIQGDPMAMIQLANSADNLINAARLTPKTRYEFYENDPYSVYQEYVENYGNPPSTIQTIRDPNKLYDFQKMGIDAANNPSRENVINTFTAISDQEGLSLKVLTKSEMESRFGEGTVGTCVNGQCGGLFGIGSKRTASVYILDPTDTAAVYNEAGNNLSQNEALTVTIQKACHEGGHACDWIRYGISDPWATEYRQKQFNAIFYDAIGEPSTAQQYQNFLDIVRYNTDVRYIPGQ